MKVIGIPYVVLNTNTGSEDKKPAMYIHDSKRRF
jgi:hypothetical protein